MTRTHIVAALVLALAACGGLDTPDLSLASVQGRVVGAASGAFAYPLGRPDLRADIGADGGYAFERIAVSTGFLVVVDGVVAGEARARLVPLRLSGGNRASVPDQFGEYAAVDDALKMPFASRVYATARVRNGAPVAAARFGVALTHLADVATQPAPLDSVAELWPVPAGLFDVAAALSGYAPGLAPGVAVPAAQTVEVEVELDVDLEDDAPGCLSTGCRGELECEDDGFCYECDENGGCPAGTNCDSGSHACVADGVNVVDACAACTGDPQCGAGNVCVPTGGAAGYCTRGCAGGAACPAGLECRNDVVPGQEVCVPPLGCAAYLAAFGADCLHDDACSYALKDGECHGRTQGDPKPGFCTAACTTDADCPASIGYTCSHVEPGASVPTHCGYLPPP